MVKVSIEDIRITERIRKEIKGIDELAEDIRRNGLINPIIVMKIENGEVYQLIAGLRRIKAAQTLGWIEIEVSVVSPVDAEAALLMEISENEQREPFTFTEKMDYARLIEDIERVKALERMSIGGKGGLKEGMDPGPYLQQGSSRDAIGEKVGMSGRTYSRAKYLTENAPPELLQQLDNGDTTIKRAYNELRDKTTDADKPSKKTREELPQKAPEAVPSVKSNAIPPKLEATQSKDIQPKVTSEKSEKLSLSPRFKQIMEQDEERLRKNREFNAMSPSEKIAELERRVETESLRANQAQNELKRFKEHTHNQIFHDKSIIDSLKRQRDDLTSELETAHAKIAELEEKLREAGLL